MEEIKNLPHANNIMLKDFAEDLFNEYQKILKEFPTDLTDSTDKGNKKDEIPF